MGVLIATKQELAKQVVEALMRAHPNNLPPEDRVLQARISGGKEKKEAIAFMPIVTPQNT